MYHLNSECLWFSVFHHPLQQDEGIVPLPSFHLLAICCTSLHNILHCESNQLCATEPLRKFHFCINFPSLLVKQMFSSLLILGLKFVCISCLYHACYMSTHIANIIASGSILVELWDTKTSSSTVMLWLSILLRLHFLFITYEFLDTLIFIALHM